MRLSNNDMMAQVQRVIAKAWAEDGLTAARFAHPKATLATGGTAVPAGLILKEVKNTSGTLQFILPPPPAAAPSDEDFGAEAGGQLPLPTWLKASHWTAGSPGNACKLG